MIKNLHEELSSVILNSKGEGDSVQQKVELFSKAQTKMDNAAAAVAAAEAVVAETELDWATGLLYGPTTVPGAAPPVAPAAAVAVTPATDPDTVSPDVATTKPSKSWRNWLTRGNRIAPPVRGTRRRSKRSRSKKEKNKRGGNSKRRARRRKSKRKQGGAENVI